MLEVLNTANVRGLAPLNAGQDTEDELQINNRGDSLVAIALPELTEIVRLNESYWAKSLASAPVVAIPTTASLFTLYNGNLAGGKCVVIDSLFMHVVAVTAAIQGWGIITCLSKVVQAVQAQSIIPNCLKAGKNTYSGNVTCGTQAMDAVSGVVGNWMPIGASPSPQNTLQIGTTIEVPVKGMIIIPPTHSMGVSVLAGAATASSVQVGCRWHEVQLIHAT